MLPKMSIATVLAHAVVVSTAVHATPSTSRCQARSGDNPPAVVELYTSEGCSSCPPADRWLSTVGQSPRVLAMAFHVNYWDHLGWQDRWATPATTERQRQTVRRQGGRYVYTPHVVVNGEDTRRWPFLGPDGLPGLKAGSAPRVQLERRPGQARVSIAAAPAGTAAKLAGYWVVLEDGLRSQVTQGENAGETLTHHHLVRLYLPVSSWDATRNAQWTLPLPDRTDADRLRVAFVVTQPDGISPVQAISLRCESAAAERVTPQN